MLEIPGSLITGRETGEIDLTRIECLVYFPPVIPGAPTLPLRCDYEKIL